AIAAAGKEFDAGLVYGSGFEGEVDALAAQARKLPDLGAQRVLLHDPSGSLKPHAASEIVTRLHEESGLPVGLFAQGASGNALAAALEAARAGADRIACAVYPVALALHRISGEGLAEALAGLGMEPSVAVEALGRASEVVEAHIGDEPVTPLAPRIAVRAAEHRVPAGLVAALDAHLRAHAAGDRIDEVLAELARVRAEAGWPPLSAPIGQILASQALVHVLSASPYPTVVDELAGSPEGWCGSPPAPLDPAVRRAVGLPGVGVPHEVPPDLDELRGRNRELAASEEALLLLALFGEDAEPLLRTIRSRGRREEALAGGAVDQARAERIRELVRIVQGSGVNEITVDGGGTRVSLRRAGGGGQHVAPA